ncbi:MAG: hypothetical protein HW377_1625 [Actinobacteria bacterium]|nr:hypothetical protein [Actinomycetota bacterium]
MKPNRIQLAVATAAVLGFLVIGCGGASEGGSKQGTTPPASSAPTLAWDPPATFSDNTLLDPYRDLDYYELYLRTDTHFTDNDVPIAQVSAVTNVLATDGHSYLQSLTDAFDLNNLLAFTQHGTMYYLSIKSVGADGLKSNFSAAIAWNQT